MRRKNLMTALLCAAVVAASTVMAPGVVMAEETEAVTEASTEAATEADTEASTEASTEEALELAERPDYKALDYVELGEYKGLTVEVEPTTVSDDEVLKQIRANAGSDILEEVTEGTVEEGDTANIDYEGKLDGEAFEGGTAKDTDLEIGSGTFIPGFEDGLVGVKIGDTVTVVKLHGEGAIKRRIMDMGLTKGTSVHVRKVAPLGDPVEVTVRGYELSLRKEDADMIEVQ